MLLAAWPAQAQPEIAATAAREPDSTVSPQLQLQVQLDTADTLLLNDLAAPSQQSMHLAIRHPTRLLRLLDIQVIQSKLEP